MDSSGLDAEIVKSSLTGGNNNQLWLRTIPIFLTFGVMGMCSALIGSTYVHLELLFGVSSEGVSQTLVIYSIGYLVGALVSGFVYDRLPRPEVAFVLANVVASVSTVVAGVMNNFVLFTVAMTLQGVAFGYNDAAGQTYSLNTWEGKKWQNSVLQASHAFWSVGGILGPLLINPFLVEVSDIKQSALHNSSRSEAIYLGSNATLSESQRNEIERSLYAYITFGVIIMSSALSFLFLFCYKIRLIRKIQITGGNVIPNVKNVDRSEKLFYRPKYIIFAALIILFSIFNLYLECLPICYIVYFALKHLNWSVLNSNRLLSCFFAFHFLGRLVAIGVSVWVKPGPMLAFNLLITLSAYILMIFSDYWQFLTWISVILAGYGVSTTFPTSVLWVSEYVKMDGKLGSLLIVGSSIGTITGPYVMSLVTSQHGSFAYVYFLLATSFIHCIIFAVQCAYAHCALKNTRVL